MASISRVKYLVVHCSATRPSMDIGVDDIRRWHKGKGWSDVGYHFVIRRDGSLEYGRRTTTAGAHVRGYNRVSLGICLIGGINDSGKSENNFTDAQFDELHTLLTSLKQEYPDATVLGHRDLSPDKDGDGVVERHEWLKDCPCFDVIPWWRTYEISVELPFPDPYADADDCNSGEPMRTMMPLLMSGYLLTAGCAGVPNSDQIAHSTLRSASIAYITRERSSEAQQARAESILSATAVLREYVEADEGSEATLDRLASYANTFILDSDLRENDKQLAQALVVELIFLAGDGRMDTVTLDESMQLRVLALLDRVDRAANVFIP